MRRKWIGAFDNRWKVKFFIESEKMWNVLLRFFAWYGSFFSMNDKMTGYRKAFSTCGHQQKGVLFFLCPRELVVRSTEAFTMVKIGYLCGSERLTEKVELDLQARLKYIQVVSELIDDKEMRENALSFRTHVTREYKRLKTNIKKQGVVQFYGEIKIYQDGFRFYEQRFKVWWMAV